MSVSGFILAGGRSSRMGTDKAWLRLGNRPVIEFVIEAMRPVTNQLSIIANRAGYESLGLPVFPDLIADQGPLSGIHAALSRSMDQNALIVACDLPFVTIDLLNRLIDAQIGFDVVVPVNQQGRTEQLCAVYSRSCLDTIEAMLNERILTPRALFERVKTRHFTWPEISDLPNAEHFFDNLNTEEDYIKALKVSSEI